MRPLIICIAGKKQTGKNTTGDFIDKYLQYKMGRIGGYSFDETFETYQHHDLDVRKYCPSVTFGSFAESLKEHCISLGFVTELQCFGEDEDKNSLSNCWKGDRQLTAREVLQEVGQFHRELNPDCWVKALDTAYKSMRPRPMLYIITDGRYPNELQWVKQQGGKVIYLHTEAGTGNHPSEQSLSLAKNADLIDLSVPAKGTWNVLEREVYMKPVVSEWFTEFGLLEKGEQEC